MIICLIFTWYLQTAQRLMYAYPYKMTTIFFTNLLVVLFLGQNNTHLSRYLESQGQLFISNKSTKVLRTMRTKKKKKKTAVLFGKLCQLMEKVIRPSDAC